MCCINITDTRKAEINPVLGLKCLLKKYSLDGKVGALEKPFVLSTNQTFPYICL